jgi:hypothetical protein
MPSPAGAALYFRKRSAELPARQHPRLVNRPDLTFTVEPGGMHEVFN